jgi:hypothetical protein
MVGLRIHKIREKNEREKQAEQTGRARGSSFSVGY